MDEKDVIEISDSNESFETAEEFPLRNSRSDKHVFDRLTEDVRNKRKSDQEKIDKMYTKREVERAHSKYLQASETSQGQSDARYSAAYWAQRNGLKTDKTARGRNELKPTTAAEMSHRARQAVVKADEYNTYRCPAINCEVTFNSKGMFDMHMIQMQHSPCHPYNHLSNRELPKRITTHLCPLCALTYRDFSACLEHMTATGHDALEQPLKIVGFLCPTCMKIYPEKQQCRIHMQDEEHNHHKYPFEDDLTAQEAEPVPIPASVNTKFLTACLEVPWHIECLNCERILNTNLKEDKFHHKHPNHTIMAFATDSVEDAFEKLLGWKFTCVQCTRLFCTLENRQIGDVHNCSDAVMGVYVDNDCKSFSEYIRRLGMSLGAHLLRDSSGGASTSSAASSSGTAHFSRSSGAAVTRSCVPRTDSPPPRYTNYAALLAVASPEKIAKEGISAPEVTFAELKRLSSSEGESCSERSTPDDSVVAVPKPCEGATSAAGAAPVPKPVPVPEPVPRRKTQEELDFEFAVQLSKKLAKEDQGGVVQKVAVSQIDADHAFALSLAKKIENEERTALGIETLSDSDDEPTSPRSGPSTSKSPQNVDTEPPRKRLKPDREESTQSRHLERPSCSAQGSNSIGGSSGGRSEILQKAWREAPDIPQGAKSIFMSPPPTALAAHSAPIPKSPNVPCPTLPGPFAGCDVRGTTGGNPSSSISRGGHHTSPPPAYPSIPLAQAMARFVQPFSSRFVLPQPTFVSPPNTSAATGTFTNPTCDKNKFDRNGRGWPRPRHRRDRDFRGASTRRHAASDPPATGPKTSSADPPGLAEMKQIVFLDVDNWRGFFARLPGALPDKTFIWGFYGGATVWTEPRRAPAYDYAKSMGLFHLHEKCGTSKDAADFALCLTVGRMDAILPPSVAFTVLSGDKGFCEVERQMNNSARRAVVINPHHKEPQEVFALIKSVGEA